MKFKGASIIGDYQYGKKSKKFKKINAEFYRIFKNIKGQILHAQTLEFQHPTKNKWVKFTSELPYEFKRMLNLLENLTS